jgi:hypothetical protein
VGRGRHHHIDPREQIWRPKFTHFGEKTGKSLIRRGLSDLLKVSVDNFVDSA